MTDGKASLKERSRQWHFIIPFFYGRNVHAGPKGGAPLNKKIEYLRRTTESILALFPNADIRLFVRDDPSEQIAKIFPFKVHRLECTTQELPYRMLVEVTKFKYDMKRDDLLFFTEDDQVIHLDDSVRRDIENAGKDLIFAPHRWSRLFFGLQGRGKLTYRLDGKQGVLYNIDQKSATPRTMKFEHAWEIQDTVVGAFATCWVMKFSTFRKIDLRLKEPPDRWLRMSSYAVFDRFPILKLSLRDGKDPVRFLADHLSGYDRHKRIFP